MRIARSVPSNTFSIQGRWRTLADTLPSDAVSADPRFNPTRPTSLVLQQGDSALCRVLGLAKRDEDALCTSSVGHDYAVTVMVASIKGWIMQVLA